MPRPHQRIATLAAVASTLVALVAAPAVAGGRPFFTSLTGANEAPGPGDPDGTGTAQLWLNPGQGTVCFELSVRDITLPTTGAHIHRAPAGDPGPIVVHLTAPDATGASEGCTTGVPRTLIQEIIRDPEQFYVNVHTLPGFGPGAVRGQLDRSSTH
jgi:hypothetical protein